MDTNTARAQTSMPAARLLAFALVGSFALGMGCGGPAEPEAFNPVGDFGFSYSGPISGVFTASGEMNVGIGVIPEAVTGATAYRQDSLIALLAFRSITSTSGDFFTVSLGRAADAIGSLNLNPLACQQNTLGSCRAGVFIPAITPAELQSAVDDPASLLQRSYVLVIGNVTVTQHTTLRIKGTFNATALPANQQSLQNMLQITNGHFDLPIRPQVIVP